MSGELQAPLVSPAQASILLDQVIFEQVLECIDLDALYRLEQSLAMLVAELDGVPEQRAATLAKAMVDRAVLRLPDDMRRYLRTSDGTAAELCELCELCEDDDTHPGLRTPAPRRSTRLRS